MQSTAGCGALERSRGRTMSMASLPPTAGAYSRFGSKITLSGMAGGWAARPAAIANRRALARWEQSIDQPVCRNAQRIARHGVEEVDAPAQGRACSTPNAQDS